MENPRPREAWHARIKGLHAAHPLRFTPDAESAMQFLRRLADVLGDDDIVTTDVGQHQMWAAQILKFTKPRCWLTSGGLGTMGFGLPAAIGAALVAEPAQRVICISGDGSILMNIQELATLAQWNLPVKVILIDNGYLGLVRQQQELFYRGRFSACEFPPGTNFMKVATAFGLEAMVYDSSDPTRLAGFLQSNRPGFLHVPVSAEEKVFPMVTPGAGNLDMILGQVDSVKLSG
jgi:acetolactate synthase I/II/III large subunit